MPPQQCTSGDVSNGKVTESLNDDNVLVQQLNCDAGYQPVGGVTERMCDHSTGNWDARFECEG